MLRKYWKQFMAKVARFSMADNCINNHIKEIFTVLLKLICGCWVFNNYKNFKYKKNLERIDKNSKYFFVKFQAPFSQKIFNIHLYTSCKAFIASIVWLWWLPNDIYFNKILFVETTKLFISNNIRAYRYICEIFYLYVPGVDSLFCPKWRAFVHNDCLGRRVFAPFKSCPGGLSQWRIVLDEIDTCIFYTCQDQWIELFCLKLALFRP